MRDLLLFEDPQSLVPNRSYTQCTELYKAALVAASDEETRFYLCGVFIEPHWSGTGVTLTATNGHVLVHIHDENGTADESAIVKLDKWILTRDKYDHRHSWKEDNGYTVVNAGESRVDGTFADYHRVIPRPDMAKPANAFFDCRYLGDLGKVGVAIHRWNNRDIHSKVAVPMRVISDDMNSPALVKWDGVGNAFGVLMPMRGSDEAFVPAWFERPVKRAA
jgi:hypothetical protein